MTGRLSDAMVDSELTRVSEVDIIGKGEVTRWRTKLKILMDSSRRPV